MSVKPRRRWWCLVSMTRGGKHCPHHNPHRKGVGGLLHLLLLMLMMMTFACMLMNVGREIE